MNMRTMLAAAVWLLAAAGLIAQSQLAPLGLTETAARTFVLNDIKGPAADRGAEIEVAGTRAFLTLPPAARGPAATALFAWVKAYVSSPAFINSYNAYRNGRLPTPRHYALSVDAQVKKDIAEQLAGFEQMRLAADKMPPQDRDMLMEQVKPALANLTNPAYADTLRAQLTAERAQETGLGPEIALEVEKTTPADPGMLFSRRLREFLTATADVNFSARTGPNPAADALGLGHNQPVDPFTLYPIPHLTGVVTAVVGAAACHAVLANGQVFSWGVGPYGTLGTTPLDELVTRVEPHFRSNTPVPVAATFDAVDVSSLGEHVLALARDGSVHAWGRGDAGQLGIGGLPMVNYRGRSSRVENFVSYPARIPGLTDVVAISAGKGHSLALLKDGTVRASWPGATPTAAAILARCRRRSSARAAVARSSVETLTSWRSLTPAGS